MSMAVPNCSLNGNIYIFLHKSVQLYAVDKLTNGRTNERSIVKLLHDCLRPIYGGFSLPLIQDRLYRETIRLYASEPVDVPPSII